MVLFHELSVQLPKIFHNLSPTNKWKDEHIIKMLEDYLCHYMVLESCQMSRSCMRR